MFQWRSWIWPGLFATILLTVLAVWTNQVSVESDLTAKLENSLAANHPWATVFVKGRDAEIGGTAPDESALLAVKDQAKSIRGIRSINVVADLLPIQSPYTFNVQRDGVRILLQGFVPNKEIGQRLVEAARGVDGITTASSKFEVARGAPENFEKFAGYSIAQLTNLNQGIARISDTNITLSGSARSVESFNTLLTTASGSAPDGAIVSLTDILPATIAPYTFSMIKSDAKLVLIGHVPSKKFQDSLVKTIKDSGDGLSVEAKLEFALGEPDAFRKLVNFSVAQLASLSSGRIDITDQQLSVEGKAGSIAGHKSVLTALENLLPEDSLLRAQKISPPTLNPYRFAALKQDGQITLEGYVPSLATRDTLRQAALKASDGGKLVDKLELALGEEDGFTSLSSFGFSQLSQLESGGFEISNNTYSINGAANSVEAYERVLAAANGTLPGGANLHEAIITGPTQSPYVWGVEKTDSSIALFGYVPSADKKDEVIKRAAAIAPELQLKDELQLALGSGRNFGALLDFGFSVLEHLKLGKVELSESDISLSGIAKNGEDYRALTTKFSNPIPGTGRLVFNSIRLPIQSPFELTVNKTENSINIGGYVPTDAFGENLVQLFQTQYKNLAVNTSLELAAGEPDNLTDLTVAASKILQFLQPGEVRLNDNDLSVSGGAIDVESYEAVQNILTSQLPIGTKLIANTIEYAEISPYVFNAEKSGNAITLSGFAPSEVTLSALLKNVADSNPGYKIANDLKLARGAESGFAALAGHGMRQLKFLSEGKFSLIGRDVEISGVAASPANYLKIKEILERPFPSGGLLTKSSVTPSAVSPFILEVAKVDNVVTLGGYAPSQPIIDELQMTAAGAVPQAKIINNIQVARGQPQGFTQLAKFMISQLVHLKSGVARLNDDQVSLEGEAKSATSYDEIKNVLSNPLPGGGVLAEQDITPVKVETFKWSVGLSDEKVLLAGNVPDEESRVSILQSIEEVAPQVPVVDNMSIASGAPEGFLDLARFAVGMLQHMNNGNVFLSQTDVTLNGEAKSPEAMERAIAQISGLPLGFNLGAQQLIPPVVTPFVWRADFSDEQLELSGFVEDDAARQTVLAAARTVLSQAQIHDDMAIAGGAPEIYGAATNFALGLLSGMSQGSVSLSDDSLMISGTVSTSKGYDKILESMKRNIPEGIQITKSEITPPIAAPYFIAFNKSGNSLKIDGFFKTSDARDKLADELATVAPGLEITNSALIARGAPEEIDWQKTISFLGKLAIEFSTATIRINDRDLSVEGNASTDEAFAKLNEAFDNIGPLKLNVEQMNISTPVIDPYTWQLVKEGDKYTVSGFAENEGKIGEYVENIKTKLATDEVATELKVGAGTPDGYDDAIELGINLFERLESGALSLSNKTVKITGEALTGIAANSVRLKVKEGLPDDYEGSHDIKVREIKEVDLVKSDRCQTLLTDTLAQRQILFEANKSIIKSQSFSLLDRLVFVAQQCPVTKLEIAGHTDADGTDIYNQKLSESRAKSVMKYLTRSGVFASRLTAVGYGESQPIADNETDEGKAKNRRIEFKIMPKEGE